MARATTLSLARAHNEQETAAVVKVARQKDGRGRTEAQKLENRKRAPRWGDGKDDDDETDRPPRRRLMKRHPHSSCLVFISLKCLGNMRNKSFTTRCVISND